MGGVLLFQGQQGPFSAPHRAQPISSGKRLLFIAFFKLRKPKIGKKKKKKTKKTKKESSRSTTRRAPRRTGSSE